MAIVLLGNTSPIDTAKIEDSGTDVSRVARPDLGNVITTFNVPDHIGTGEALTIVASVFASHHSDDKAAWVESDDKVVEAALARDFDCPVGRPIDWDAKPTEETSISANEVAA